MAAVVRYMWMFRTAAVVFAGFGAMMLWRFGLAGYEPRWRPVGLAAGFFAVAIGVFLLRRSRLAIGLSAAAAAFICLCATLAAPSGKGPVALFFAGVALVCGAYAVLALRALLNRSS